MRTMTFINKPNASLLEDLNIKDYKAWLELNKNYANQSNKVRVLLSDGLKDFSIVDYINGDFSVTKSVTDTMKEKENLFDDIKDLNEEELFFYLVNKVGSYDTKTKTVSIPDTRISDSSYLKGNPLELRFIDGHLVGKDYKNKDVIIDDVNELYRSLEHNVYYVLLSKEKDYELLKYDNVTEGIAISLLTSRITMYYPFEHY